MLWLPLNAKAQFRTPDNTPPPAAKQADSTTQQDSTTTLSLLHSNPTLTDIGFQFLAGEIAFNATSFALWGDDLYRDAGMNELSGLGIFVSMFTVPYSIQFISHLLHLKKGSWGWSVLGALSAFCLITIPLAAHVRHPISYLDQYLIISLPLIGVAQAVYDLTMR